MANTACAISIPTISSAFISKDGAEILSAIKAPRYVDYINILFGRVFSDEYINNKSYTTLSDFTDDSSHLSVNGNLINLYNKVKTKLKEDVNSGFYDTLPMKTVTEIMKINKNWDLFINYHSKYNSFISIKDGIDIESEEKELFDKKGNEYSEFELISNEIRTLFKFLPKAEIITDKNGAYKIVEAYSPEDGLPMSSDFETIFKLTLDALKGITDENEFINTLTSKDLIKKIPELEFLFQILPVKDGGVNSLSPKQRILFHKFYLTFSKDYVPVHLSIKTKEEKKGELPTHIRTKAAKGNIEKILRQFTSSFSSKPGETEHVRVDGSIYKEGMTVNDSTEDLIYVNSAIEAGYGRKRLFSLPSKKNMDLIQLTDEQLNTIPVSTLLKKYDDHISLLNMIGITFSDLSLLDSYSDKVNLVKILNYARIIHDNITERLEQGRKIYNPILDLTGKEVKYIGADGKQKIIKSLRNEIKDIVEFEGKFSKVSPTIMSRGASGEKQSDITYSSALSIATRQISKAKSLTDLYGKSYFKKLKYNPLHKGSFVGTNIIGTTNKYTIENYSGHNITEDEDTLKLDTRNLSDVRKFESDINNLLGWGVINTPQLESKAGYFALKFLDKNDKAILPFAKENFEEGFMRSTGSEFTTQILNYLKGELDRVKGYETLKKESYNVPESYGELHIFKDMLSKEDIKTLQKEKWDINHPIIQKAMPKIDKFFQDQFENLTNFIDKNGMTNFISKQVLRNQKLTESLYHESQQVYQDILLRTFIANDFIHNVEFGIYVSGDPLFFEKTKGNKIVGDWHKRLGGIASTGTTPGNTKNLRMYFQSTQEVQYWDTFSLRGILNQLTDTPSQRRDNFDTFTSAVLKEDTVSTGTNYHAVETVLDYMFATKLNTGKEITKEQAMQDLQIASLKIDVGDGQGYLNLDAHRELSIKQGTFRPQHDVSYMFEALTFKKILYSRRNLGEKLTEEEQGHYEKLQSQIIKDPNKYAIPILKQTYYGTMANEEVKMDAKVFDKFALAPLLPTVAKNHPKLQDLLFAMAERQIHYVKYESGTKAYVRNVIDKVSDLVNPDIKLDELQSELLKLQITPSKKEKTQTKIPSQMVKLIYTNLFDKGNANVGVVEARDKFLKALNDIQSTNKKSTLSKLGFVVDESGQIKSWDKSKIIDRVVNQINIQKLPSNLLEALQLNSKGEFINTIESSGVYQQLLNYIVGKMDSGMREFKMTGGDFVLLSESMFGTPLKYSKLSKDRSIIESLECRVTLTKEFSKLLNLPDPKDIDKTIGTIERLNELIKDKTFYKKYEKELTITFSRPPVQGPNSMGVGRVVEFFFPTVGNVLQLPKEFMHQAGIDFDYDKEKVLTPALSDEGVYISETKIQERLSELEEEYKDLREIFNYYDEYEEESEDNEVTRNTAKLITSVFQSATKDVKYIPEDLDELSEKAYEYIKLRKDQKLVVQNSLLQSIISSLQLPELYSELILPNTNTTVKPLAESNGRDINSMNILPVGKNVYSYQENLKVFKMFNDAKALLGSFALQNVFSQLVAPLDIKINLDYDYDNLGNPKKRVNNMLLKNKDRVISMSTREDDNGDNKQHLTSEFINATVDSAKDPYFSNFMLSRGNINTFLYLFTLNYPIQTIVDFTSSAIIRKYIDVKDKTPGMTLEQRVEITLRESNIPTTKTIKFDSEQIDVDHSELLKNLKELKKDSTLGKEQFNRDHMLLLSNFIAMEEHAQEYSSFRSIFKSDTNKVTSIFEIFSKQSIRSGVISKSMFSLSDVMKVENESTMTAFRNEDVIKEVLEQVFPIVSQPLVVNTLGNLFVQRKSSLNDNESRVLSQVITNDYIGAILFTYGQYKDRSIYEYGKDLVRKRENENGVFNETLLERIAKFKENEEYDTLLSQFSVLGKIVGDVSEKPIKGNPIYRGKNAFNLRLDVDTSIPLIQKENYMNQFKQIIEGDFEASDIVKSALVNFIKDFFVAGLIQTGFNKTGLSYLEYIPIKFTQELLKPALAFYNHQMDNNPDNAKLFLSNFAMYTKMNNPSFYPKVKNAVKSSYLGKQLRVITYDDVDYTTYDEEGPLVENPISVDNTGAIEPTPDVQPVNSFTYKDKTIPTEFALGEEQVQALKDLIDFSNQDSIDAITMQGAAGTGKTSIIGYLQKYLGSRASFAYLAPTHAATAELAFATVKTGNTVLPATLQSAISLSSKTKSHVFSIKIQKRLTGTNPIVVLDEASMIDATDIAKIQEAISDIGGKVIFLGDMKQISKVNPGEVKTKPVSPAFTDFKQVMLTKIFRQSNNKLLSLLSMMREQNDFKLFKVDNSDNVKFVSKKEYNKELINDLETNAENTVVISYTNSSVKSINLSARKVLGREGQTVVGDIVIGYLGYASKQIEKGDIANSVSYTIKSIEENGPVRAITVQSAKLAKLIGLGIRGISSDATTNYYQLAGDDSISFDNLTETEYKLNNIEVAKVFKQIHNATISYNEKRINYATYLGQLAAANDTLRKYSVGNDYIYNPKTDQMERFDVKKHAGIKSNGQGSLKIDKDIDYGHAITIHKSQGATIENVYFDSGSLNAARNTPIVDTDGNQITTEKQSLAYVAMSRSKNKLVVYEGENTFEMITSDKEETVKQEAPKKTPHPASVESKSTEREYTSENITSLKPNEIFVFGSNPLGINGNPEKYPNMSASRATASGWVKQGEKMDNRLSDSGKAWGITTVTKPGAKLSKTPEQIGKGIQDMLMYAKENPDKKFLVTKFGTENAGHSVSVIKELFEKLKNFIPENVILPKEFEVRDVISSIAPKKTETPRVSTKEVFKEETVPVNETPVEIGVPTRGTKLESYKITPRTGTDEVVTEVTKKGYKLTIEGQPNTNFFITKQLATQEFGVIDNKEWYIEDQTTGYRLTRDFATIKDALAEFSTNVNKGSKNPEVLKKLQTTGLFTSVEVKTENEVLFTTYGSKSYILEGSEEDGFEVYTVKNNIKNLLIKDQSLINKVTLSYLVRINPKNVVTLLNMKGEPSYYVDSVGIVQSLQKTSYGEQITSSDVYQRVIDIFDKKPATDIPEITTADFVDHSGGAFGADMDGWDKIGKQLGFVNFNHYYTGEKGPGNAPGGNVEISENSVDYQEGRVESAKAAAVTYGYQYGAMKDARLIRNWAQVKHSDAVFAIGTIVGVGKPLFPNIPGDTRLAKVVAVTGGTGYAVQMAINNNKPVYVFDQARGSWAKNINGVWSRMTEAPILTKNYAGIGSRNLTPAGLKAIREVYEKTIASLNSNKLTQEEQDNLNKNGFKPGPCK